MLTTVLSTAANIALNFIPGGKLIKTAIGAVSGAVSAIAAAKAAGQPVTFGKIAMGAAVGAGTALLSAVVGNKAAKMITGAAVGAITGAASAYASAKASGQPITWQNLTGAALGGAAGGLVSNLPGIDKLPPAARGAIVGAVNGGVTAFATGALNKVTGASDQSWGEIAMGTLGCAAVGAATGAITGAIAGAIANRQNAKTTTRESATSTTSTETNRTEVEMGPYSEQDGHHPMASSAFNGDEAYSRGDALTLSNEQLNSYGVRHPTITGQQRSLYSAYSQTGQPLTMDTMQDIEVTAMVNAGMPQAVAQDAVQQATNQLGSWGITSPTRIPWGK